MTRAQQDRISWLWWDWHNPFDGASYHITTNGRFGSWKSQPSHPYQPNHGSQVALNHAASIQNTSGQDELHAHPFVQLNGALTPPAPRDLAAAR